jgi:hypothetical protein
MNRELVDRVVRAVLYEGYLLYPYRPSVKNRQRWTFGGLYPPACCTAGGGDTWSMQTECLVAGGPGTAVEATARFLHLQARRIAELPAWRFVETLNVGDQWWQTWQEAVEREVSAGETTLGDLAARPRRNAFAFAARREEELLRDPSGEVVGAAVRELQPVAGEVELAAAQVAEGDYKLTCRVENRTPWEPAGVPARDEALLRALVSTHTVLGVRGGAFVSLLDPPEPLRELVAGCRNVGTWPVLVGDEGDTDTLLSSPIILYDYPQVAPESPGDLFDAAEIDEILTLRILTLTKDEKRRMAAVDERARALLQRTEALSGEQMAALHGTIRCLRPAAEESHD